MGYWKTERSGQGSVRHNGGVAHDSSPSLLSWRPEGGRWRRVDGDLAVCEVECLEARLQCKNPSPKKGSRGSQLLGKSRQARRD